jgi:MFS family permease
MKPHAGFTPTPGTQPQQQPGKPLQLIHFLIGYFISRIGDALYSFCLPLLSYRLTGSVLVMSSMFAVSVLPVILFAPFAGVILDRFQRKRLMLLADLIRMGLIALIPVLDHYGLLAIWHLYVIAVLLSLLSTGYDIAVVTIIPVLSAKQLTRGNAGVQTAGQLADMLGPAVAGGLASRSFCMFCTGFPWNRHGRTLRGLLFSPGCPRASPG